MRGFGSTLYGWLDVPKFDESHLGGGTVKDREF